MRLLKLAALASAVAMATPALAVDFIYNPTPGVDITIPANGTGPGQASPFPVSFNVSGLGTVTDVNLTIGGLSHTWMGDLRIWLVSATGTTIVLMDNAGGSSDFTNNNITFDQSASGFVGGNLQSGNSYSFRPSVYDAVGNNLSSSLNAFNGEAANGVWKLFIYDDASADSGRAQSATLSITATPAVPEPATWGMMIAGFGIAGAAMRRRAAKVSFA